MIKSAIRHTKILDKINLYKNIITKLVLIIYLLFRYITLVIFNKSTISKK